ncbi:hypothetical protein [Afifella sp. IM 167]|uniref:hypothetical protein n=1 Tax=Afifella sp. IM 167 TaxID=2033586 RepID=UPI001CCA61EE|nr:hypothetical protein [Afifella sp. IM 167]MBZ8133225.1 hypothetical protein [Afifella sp. IM 167]
MKQVPLSKSYTAHGEVFSRVVLRAPKFEEYFEIGSPQEVVYGASAKMLQTDRVVVRKYLDILVEAPVARGALAVIDELADVMALEEAVLGFFTQAREQMRRSESSSSGSDGDRKTSDD